MVDGFANYFSESFVHPSANGYMSSDLNANTFGIPSISEDEVGKAIKQIKANCTMGPDMIPAFLIKDCASVLATPLAVIFNLIIKTSCFPTLWKLSRVCPIYKKGNRNELTNYRPITIICNFAKILEIILHSMIYNHVSGLISCEQHGFMKGRSTVTNLVCKSQFISEKLDQQSQVDIIYTDFAKAFDRLDHGILLNKLNSFGLSSPLVQLFRLI